MTEADFPLVLGWWNDPEVAWYADSMDNAAAYTPESLAEILGRIAAAGHVFVVEHDGRPVGECWLQRMNLEEVTERFPGKDLRRIDLAIGAPGLWGRGLGTETIRLLTEFGFDRQGADAIFGCGVRSDNPQSYRAFRRVGYTFFQEQEFVLRGASLMERNLILPRVAWGPSLRLDDSLSLSPARANDEEAVIAIYEDASAWLKSRGIVQWRESAREGRMARYFQAGVELGKFWVVRRGLDPVGSFRLSWGDSTDGQVWADRSGPAAYLHSFAIRRAEGGGGIGLRVLCWIEGLAHSLGLPLRLDCVADNPRLRRYYEDAGYAFRGETGLETGRAVARYERDEPTRRRNQGSQ